MRIHKAITFEVLEDACERQMCGLDNPGFCIQCGEEQDGCEPDARGYHCEECDTQTVFGAMELLMETIA